MRKPTFEEVIYLDNNLYQLAIYEVTKGQIVIPKSMPQLIKLQDKIADKFNYYKRQIQSGECTYEFIKWHILGTYGAYPQSNTLDYDELTSYIGEEDSFDISPEQKHSSPLDTLLDAFERRLRRESNPFDIPPDTGDEEKKKPSDDE
jgi:hypothetical protein